MTTHQTPLRSPTSAHTPAHTPTPDPTPNSVTPPELTRPGWALSIPSSDPLVMIKMSARFAMSEAELAEQLLGRLLSSSLAYLPKTPAERACP